jgi:DNA polymerase II small subunit
MVSNPAYLALDKTDDFLGITLLMYHGGSLPWYADNIPSIRRAGGQKCADDLMIALLKRRHMCPAHGAYLYVPDPDEDALIIDPIPDIFVTGHVHRAQTKNYRNVTCINSSCWTAITENQEKRGLEPQPGRAFVVSLKTREVKMLNFSTVKDTKSVAEYRRQKEEQEEKVRVKKEAA